MFAKAEPVVGGDRRRHRISLSEYWRADGNSVAFNYNVDGGRSRVFSIDMKTKRQQLVVAEAPLAKKPIYK